MAIGAATEPDRQALPGRAHLAGARVSAEVDQLCPSRTNEDASIARLLADAELLAQGRRARVDEEAERLVAEAEQLVLEGRRPPRDGRRAADCDPFGGGGRAAGTVTATLDADEEAERLVAAELQKFDAEVEVATRMQEQQRWQQQQQQQQQQQGWQGRRYGGGAAEQPQPCGGLQLYRHQQ